jgi:hypothetical protein
MVLRKLGVKLKRLCFLTKSLYFVVRNKMAEVYFLTQFQSSLILAAVLTGSKDGVGKYWNYSTWVIFCADLLEKCDSY